MKDIIIVGGGPSGCFLGEKLAEKGFEVTILEEHGEIGQPMCCSGIVGKRGLREKVGLNPENWSVNKLRSGVFHSPSDNVLELSRNQVEAHVIDRSRFDRDLAERSLRAGAEIKLNTKFVGASRDDSSVTVETENQNGAEEIKSRMIIGADGTNSIVARNLGLMDSFSPLVGAQAEIVGEADSDKTHVFLGNELSENFFGWVTPSGEVFRVGLCDRKRNVRRKLLGFIVNNPILPQNAENKIVHFTTGLIPKPGQRKICGDRVIPIGDAAGHTKPLTGGGLYLGLLGAKIASEILPDALEKKPLEKNLVEYENRINERFEKEFELGNRVMRIFRKMSDEDISKLLEILKKPEIRELLLENAEFDHHSELIKSLGKKIPTLIQSFGARKSMKYLSWFASS